MEERIAAAKAFEEDQKARKAASKQFWEAVHAGNVDRVRELLQITPLDPTDAKFSMMSESVLNSPEVMRCILEQGAEPYVTRELGEICNTLDTFKVLSEFGLDFKAQGYKILEQTVGRREILDWLLDQGVNVNSYSPYRSIKKGDRDDTVGVLNEAAALGDTALFDYLVSRGADPKRSIALHEATRCKDPVKTAAIIDHLVEKYNFDVDADDSCGGLRDFFGDQPQLPLDEATSRHNATAVRALLKHGAKSKDRSLCTAVLYEAIPEMRILLDVGADATRACFFAARINKLTAARVCLEYGADVDAVEAKDREWAANPGIGYYGMESEMHELLDEWKSKKPQGDKEGDAKDLTLRPKVRDDTDKKKT